MRKIKIVKIGDYVLVTRWRDKDPNDPWRVGYINGYGVDTLGNYYKVKDSEKYWRCVFRLTLKEGQEWILTNNEVGT